jgi:hypothetical protein
MQAVSILKCAIVAGEGSSKPTMLSSFHSLSFSGVLLATGGALEHNLFLCPLPLPPFDLLWVCALLAQTWVLSLCPSFPSWLTALFNEVTRVLSK